MAGGPPGGRQQRGAARWTAAAGRARERGALRPRGGAPPCGDPPVPSVVRRAPGGAFRAHAEIFNPKLFPPKIRTTFRQRCVLVKAMLEFLLPCADCVSTKDARQRIWPPQQPRHTHDVSAAGRPRAFGCGASATDRLSVAAAPHAPPLARQRGEPGANLVRGGRSTISLLTSKFCRTASWDVHLFLRLDSQEPHPQ